MEDKTIKDYYSNDAAYLIQWFLSSQVDTAFNGMGFSPMMKPILNYPDFNANIKNSFFFLNSLLLEQERNKPK